MKKKEINMDLPEVNDIPGQENVKPPRIKEMEDTTASSADEEGEGLLDDVNNDEIVTDETSNVSSLERGLLTQAANQHTDEMSAYQEGKLDNRDDEKEKLNEKGTPNDMGADLDVPGSEEDDDNEEIGEEDEENNSYSLPDQDS